MKIKLYKHKKLLEIVAWSVATAVLGGALVYYNFIHKVPVVEKAEVGKPCPDFTLNVYKKIDGEYEPNGGYFNVSEQQGKVTVINFWATWCGPCVAEIPHFEELYQNYKEDISVIAINGDAEEPDVSAFLTEKWQTYEILFGQDTNEVNAYGHLGGDGTMPMTVVLDREGVVVEHTLASVTYETLEEMITPYI